MIELVAKLPSDAELFEYAFLCRRSWSVVVLIGLVAKLESRLPVDAKYCEYAICTGEVCRGSIVLLVDARVRVLRVLWAVLTWLLVLVSTVWSMGRTSKIGVPKAEVVWFEGMFVLVWPRRLA